ncbi:hypothetical protein [Laspinema olomoucense]|uniref:hypothetical protein n=1 Tax=Laspinema olomoucense TaxID=3231600 RepID=UPI0021BA5486|nr:hypothetical protein [Laspinema sp. D3a]MCT7990809.1 hypothetical protein [Laspinema sp. D3a]
MSFFYGKASECSRRSLLGIHAVWVVRAIALSLLGIVLWGSNFGAIAHFSASF